MFYTCYIWIFILSRWIHGYELPEFKITRFSVLLTSFVNVYVYHCYHDYIHIPSLYTTGVIYKPEGSDTLESRGYEVYSSLSKFVRTNSLWYLFDFKLQLLFFYVFAFHNLMNIFTFRHYRQNEQLYLSLLTGWTWNVKNKIILEEHSIYYSFRKSNIWSIY
jgi:hypothetical protein